MSALARVADSSRTSRDVRKVPATDVASGHRFVPRAFGFGAVLDFVLTLRACFGTHNKRSAAEMGHAVGPRSRTGDFNQQD